MQTLIIYDSEGIIISQMGGDVREPVGVPFLWAEVPQGKYIVSIDVSGEEHIPIFTEHQKSEMEVLDEKLVELALETDYRLCLIELGLI